MSTPPAVVFLPLGEYQESRLREAIAALAWSGYHPDLVDHERRHWGATPDEAKAIVNELRWADRAAA